MPETTAGRPRKKAAKRAAPSGARARRPTAQVDRHIAAQLKALYDGVVNEPIPDRLVQLIDRLDSDAKR